MTRIPSHTIENAPPASRPMLEILAQKSRTLGRLLGLHAQMAHSPAALAAYLGMRRALEEHGTLEPRTRTGLMLVAGALDGSAYVEALDTMLARASGWSEPEIRTLRDLEPLGERRLDALLAVAREAARGGEVGDETWNAALAAGWSSAELLEANATIALTHYVSGFARLAKTPLDVPATLPAHAGVPALGERDA